MKQIFRPALSLLAALSGACAAAADLTDGLQEADFSTPATEADLRGAPLRPVGGNPPPGGLRHWRGPLYRMESFGCYVSFLERPGENGGTMLEKWENEWGADASGRGLIFESGPGLATLGPPVQAVSGEIIDDVFTPASDTPAPAEPKTLSPLRGMTRPSVTLDPEFGHVAFVCVAADYRPGSVYLVPAILTSPDGRPGTWTYRGQLKGEPADELPKNNHHVWSDGGSLFRMPDGSWRAYVNNYGGVSFSLLMADSLDGPWRFLRDGDGAIRGLLPDAGTENGPDAHVFPHVLRVSDGEWHCWASDQWPPQSIWHYVSADGIEWRPYGEQPEITRELVGGRSIKNLRTYVEPGGGTIYGFLSVWDYVGVERGRKGWRLHVLRLPVGDAP
jgi:hypothetical protein